MPVKFFPLPSLKVNQSFEHLTLEELISISNAMQHVLTSSSPFEGIKIEKGSLYYQLILTQASEVTSDETKNFISFQRDLQQHIDIQSRIATPLGVSSATADLIDFSSPEPWTSQNVSSIQTFHTSPQFTPHVIPELFKENTVNDDPFLPKKNLDQQTNPFTETPPKIEGVPFSSSIIPRPKPPSAQKEISTQTIFADFSSLELLTEASSEKKEVSTISISAEKSFFYFPN